MKTPEEYFKLTPSTGLINESNKIANNIYTEVKLIISKMEDMHNNFIVNRDKLEEYVQLRIKETQQQVSVKPVVKPEIAITIIKTKITQLEELAEKYKGEWDIESYTDCLGQRNTLKGVLTEIEKQFSV